MHECAETSAFLAGSEGVVEREHPRTEILHADAVLRARVALGEQYVILSLHRHYDQRSRKRESGLHGVGDPPRGITALDDAVHHYLYVVFFVLVDPDLVVEVVNGPVHPHSGVSVLLSGFQFLLIGPLSAADDGSKDLQPGSVLQHHHRIHHLVYGLLFYLSSAYRTVGNADVGVQQPHVVVHFGDGPDRGSGVLGSRLLIDGYGRRQPFYRVHVRLVHLSQKLPGVAGEALHVSALPVGEYRIERKRGFPGAG